MTLDKTEYMRQYRVTHPVYVAHAKEQKRQHTEEHREEINARARARRLANPEKFRTYKKAFRAKPEQKIKSAIYNKTYRATHQAETRAKLIKRYGLSVAEYAAMLKSQNGACAICYGTHNNNHALCIDHDHMTGKIRGLVCHDCNVALGMIGDDPEVARSIITYLEKYRSREEGQLT